MGSLRMGDAKAAVRRAALARRIEQNETIATVTGEETGFDAQRGVVCARALRI